MSVSLVQTVHAAPGSGALVITIAATQYKSRIVALVVTSFNTDTVSSITDNAGNVWAKKIGATNSTDAEIWSALSLASATQVTINFSNTQTHDAYIREYSGVSKNNAIDQSASGTTGGTSMVTSATPITQYQQGVVVVCVSYQASAQTLSVGAGYSNFLFNDNGVILIGIEDKTFTSAAAQTGAMTSSFSSNFIMVLAVFYVDTPVLSKATSYINNLRPHAFSPGLAR